MRISRTVVWAVVALVVWLVLSWFLPSLFHVNGTDLWLLRAGFAILGVAATIGFLWWSHGHPSALSGPVNPELDLTLREAEAKLRNARIGSLADLPSVFVLGDTNTAKTSVILRSGLEPELLAGMAQHDGNVLPTGGLNIWLARGAILYDAAGSVWMNPASRQSLFRRLASIRLSKVVANSAPAPRSVVVCVESGGFLAAGAGESMIARARQLRGVLGEISQTFGVRLPVYVLFTKLDELAHFAEYASNFSEPEACEALGATLPLDRDPSMEKETQRLNQEFIRLTNGLAEQRLDLLGREHDETKLRPIYEFPREFGKLRSLLVQFLVEMSRPSQLGVNPYLRGFFFTGLRAVLVNDSTPAPAAAPQRQQAFDPNATGVFMSGIGAKASPGPLLAQPTARKIPQWVHLSRIFPHIVLQDNVALESSSSSVRVDFWRRAAIISAAGLALLVALMWTVSFARNYSLAAGMVRAARDPALQGASGGAISLDSLKQLDDIREPLSRLEGFRRSGSPWNWGFGLYAGDDLYESAYRAYFGAFRKLLLSGTQADLLKVMNNPAAAQNGSWAYTYEALKAYLITTSHPEKSTSDFLSPALLKHTPTGLPADTDRAEMASRQYLFYADQLPRKNPYPASSTTDDNAVQNARAFLKRSSTIEPLYQQLLSSVNGTNPPFVFNKQYPRSAEVVLNNYPVPFAFTREGWALMVNRLQNPGSFRGEEWVLGPEAYANVDPSKVKSELEERYRTEFVKTWREYLKATRFVGYAGTLEDVKTKLDRLSDNQSPLTASLCEASEHTLAAAKPVADLFQPPQQVTPAGCRQSATGAAKDYLNALATLAGSVNTLISDRNSEAFRTDAIMKATAAEATVRQLARNFPIDKEGEVDKATLDLLLSPIQRARPPIDGLQKERANGSGRSLCGQFNSLVQKYPFKQKSPDASVQEVADFFKPDSGALARFYQEAGQKLLMRQGNAYLPAAGGSMAATSAFAEFFTKAMAVSSTFFSDGGAQPKLSFSIRVIPSDDVLGVTLTIGQQSLPYKPGSPAAQRFSWTPGVQDATSLEVQFIGGTRLTYPSTSTIWAPFDFIQRGDKFAASGSGITFERTMQDRTEPMLLSNKHPATVRFALDPGGAAEQLRPGYFPFACPVPAVR